MRKREGRRGKSDWGRGKGYDEAPGRERGSTVNGVEVGDRREEENERDIPRERRRSCHRRKMSSLLPFTVRRNFVAMQKCSEREGFYIRILPHAWFLAFFNK
ncbi:unnamed protein product [Musa textilis]